MGTIQYRSTIVRVAYNDDVDEVYRVVKERVGTFATEPRYLNNGGASIFIHPEGSKVGWPRHVEHLRNLMELQEDLRKLGKVVNLVYIEDGELGNVDTRVAFGPRRVYTYFKAEDEA